MAALGIEPATFLLVAQGLSQLHHRVPQRVIKMYLFMLGNEPVVLTEHISPLQLEFPYAAYGLFLPAGI
jgi:hypothetical protein